MTYAHIEQIDREPGNTSRWRTSKTNPMLNKTATFLYTLYTPRTPCSPCSCTLLNLFSGHRSCLSYCKLIQSVYGRLGAQSGNKGISSRDLNVERSSSRVDHDLRFSPRSIIYDKALLSFCSFLVRNILSLPYIHANETLEIRPKYAVSTWDHSTLPSQQKPHYPMYF